MSHLVIGNRLAGYDTFLCVQLVQEVLLLYFLFFRVYQSSLLLFFRGALFGLLLFSNVRDDDAARQNGAQYTFYTFRYESREIRFSPLMPG